jgi:aspartyl-tRNA(Asn)/glutamyl-tRNA(Gln) amidotransferase subunit A
MGEIENRVKRFLEKIKKEDKGKNGINAFLYLNPEILKEAKALDNKKGKPGKLFGKVFGIKSAINVNGMICNAASKTLENYKSGYDATVIEKIKGEDGLIIGMCNCDEFCSGSSGENSAFGPTRNPRAEEKIPGGSSSGSAAAVSAGFCDIAIGSDTGGSIRNPASLCGVVGVKGSYGLVSRHGLMDLAMSFDTIGPIAKTVEEAAEVLDVISGKDSKDTKTFESKVVKVGKLGKIRVGVLKIKGVDPGIQKMINEAVEKWKKKKKWETQEVLVPHAKLGVEAYYPIVYVEAFSASRRLDGRKYGKKVEDSCGPEFLRRILGGSEITKAEFHGKYYQKALEVKRLIAEEFKGVFKKVDCVVLPVVPELPWDLGKGSKMDTEKVYAYDALTVLANLAGIPGVSVPIGELEGIPVGLQILCDKNEDSKMLSIAKEVENLSK